MLVAMPTLSTTKMTAEQFFQLGEDPVGIRLELVDGEIAVGPSITPRHSYATMQLATFLDAQNDSQNIGEVYSGVGIVLDHFTVRRPDILYYQKARTHLVGEIAMQGPPDLAVEVISPSSVEIDRVDKFAQYRSAGVANYWIVDPGSKTIEAWRLENGQYISAGRGEQGQTVQLPPFPDLSIPLSRLWRD